MAGGDGVVGEEGLRKLRANLVRPLGNAWANGRTDAAARGAKRRHLCDHGLGDSGKRAPPARMPRANGSGNRVVKQDRRAIRREHAERNAGSGGDQRVGARRFFAAPRLFHGDDRGAVDLARGHQTIGRQVEAIHRDRSVADDPVRQIARAEAAIERCERAFADATRRVKKPWRTPTSASRAADLSTASISLT